MKTDFLQWIGNLLGIGFFMLLLACIARNECYFPSTYPVMNSSSSTAIEKVATAIPLALDGGLR